MRLHRLRSFEGYPEECCHADEGECSGQITPYIGERDSFGYEVVGYCEHHYKHQLDTTSVCDECGNETTHLRFCYTLLKEVCPTCYSRELEY